MCLCTEQPDELNTIIKIYSDAHVGLTSKWLVHSTDRSRAPIREPEERRYTQTNTGGDTVPFSDSRYLSLPDTSLYSQYLETIAHADTSATSGGNSSGLFAAGGGKALEPTKIREGSEGRTREGASEEGSRCS